MEMNPEIKRELNSEVKPGSNAETRPANNAETMVERGPQSQSQSPSQIQARPQGDSQPESQAAPQTDSQIDPPIAPPQVDVKLEKPCRHEFVRIYQRKLKGLDRRLVSTRAYLPIGFKQADFGHLSEGYCFCTKCRTRLYPRRTTAEKAAARISNLQAKAGLGLAAFADAEDLNLQQLPELLDSLPLGGDIDQDETEKASESHVDVHVEELELESVDVQDIEAEGVKLMDDGESCSLAGEEDI